MKLYIYSKFGVLDCQPMTLQAIENSIPESELFEQNQDLQGETDDGAQVIEAPSDRLESETSD